jgi:hypothetical protein
VKYITHILILYFLSNSFIFAQEQDVGIYKVQGYDTTSYCTYEDRLVIGLFQASQNFNLEIQQKNVADPAGKSHINYFSDAASANGIVFDYDKLNLSITYKTLPQLDSYKKGNNKASGFGLNLGGDKWQLEANFRHYSWFYDMSTALYDTSYKDNKPYYQNPSMNASSLKFKFMYFFRHHKFSYQSAYACNERQLKSAFSPVFVANVYINDVTADSSFIPYFVRSFYGYNADINGMHTVAYTAGGGISGTLVIHKRFFLNGMVMLGLESQYNQYHHYISNVTNKANYINWASDFRMAFGFNNRNFFATVNLINDLSQYASNAFKMNTNFKSFSFTIGYRFKVPEPKFMPKVRKTKIYNLF